MVDADIQESRLDIFLDESGDSTIFALCGLIGAGENWAGFVDDWNNVLAKHGLSGTALHMRELQGSQNEPWLSLRTDLSRVEALLDDLVGVIIAHALAPFGAVLLLEEYNALGSDGKKRWPNPYKLCFETALGAAYETCDISGARRIFVTFDKGCNEGWAKQAYAKVIKGVDAKVFADEAAFEDDKDRAELCAADMVAYELRRAFYNYHVHNKDELRPSFQRLMLNVPCVFWKVRFDNVIDKAKVIGFPNADGAVGEIFLYQDDPRP